MKLKFAFFIALFCCSLLLHLSTCANTFPRVRKQYTDINGLSENTVRNIFKDHRGYLWLSTLNGLNRFDGHRFTHPDNWPGDMHVKNIFLDKNGLMWIETSSNKYVCYNPESRSFINLRDLGAEDEYANLLESQKGSIFLWNPKGTILRLSSKEKDSFHPQPFKVIADNETQTINSLKEDTNGDFWIAHSNGISLLQGDAIKTIRNGEPFADVIIQHKLIHAISSDGHIYRINPTNFSFQKVNRVKGKVKNTYNIFQAKNTIYISHESGTEAFNTLDESLRDIPELPFNAKFLIDNEGNGWIGDRKGGITRIDGGNDILDHYEVASPTLIEKVGYERYNVYQDIKGRRWIATYGNGIFCIDPSSGQSKHYDNNAMQQDRLPSNYVLSISGDSLGNIWVGTEHEGLVQLTDTRLDFNFHYPAGKEYHDRSNSFRFVYAVPDGDVLAGNRYAEVYSLDRSLKKIANPKQFAGNVMTATIDKSQHLWLGLRQEGILIQHGDTAVELKPEVKSNVFDLLVDNSNRVWCAMFDMGIGVVTKSHEKGYNFQDISFMRDYGSNWRNLKLDKNGFIWASSNDGVVIFHPDSLLRHGKSATHHFNKENGLPGNEIREIVRSSDGRMWIAVLGVGIMVCDGPYSNGFPEFKIISTENGLVNNLVQALVEDSEGNVWAATERNLSRIDKHTGLIDNYSPGESGNNNIFLESAAIMLEDGRLLFGTDYGLLSFDPTQIKIDRKTTTPILTDFKMNDKSISVDVSTMGFDAEDATIYSYYLEGYDKEWSFPTQGGHIEYSDLPAGKYILKVKARDKEAMWSDEVSIIEFKVPISWKASIFMLLGLFAVVIAGVMVYLKLRRRAQSATMEQPVSDSKGDTELAATPDHQNLSIQSDDITLALEKIVDSHLSDADYGIEDFASDMNMSRSALYNIFKSKGLPAPMEYLRSRRLEEASRLLVDGRYNISEVANMVGMKDPLYFSRCFKQRFGMSPSSFIKKKKNENINEIYG